MVQSKWPALTKTSKIDACKLTKTLYRGMPTLKLQTNVPYLLNDIIVRDDGIVGRRHISHPAISDANLKRIGHISKAAMRFACTDELCTMTWTQRMDDTTMHMNCTLIHTYTENGEPQQNQIRLEHGKTYAVDDGSIIRFPIPNLLFLEYRICINPQQHAYNETDLLHSNISTQESEYEMGQDQYGMGHDCRDDEDSDCLSTSS